MSADAGKSKPLVSHKRLRELLHYDPLTGIFRWCVTHRVIKSGDRAGSIESKGYRVISVDGRRYKAARLAWLYSHGGWPPCSIDHHNLIKDDDRLDNLREATNSQNGANQHRRNQGKLKGVFFDKRMRSRPWRAFIRVNRKGHSLGYFATPEQAHAAYCAAAREFYGEFARAA